MPDKGYFSVHATPLELLSVTHLCVGCLDGRISIGGMQLSVTTDCSGVVYRNWLTKGNLNNF